MSTVAISVKQPSAIQAFISQDGRLTREGMLYFLQLCNSFQLITQDTTSGPVAVTLPPANTAPNYEISAVKISSDGNLFSLVAAGSDLINGAGTLNVGTTQYASKRLKSDGFSNWYVC